MVCQSPLRMRTLLKGFDNVLDLLEAGLTPVQVVDELPDLEPSDVRASVAYGRLMKGSAA